MNSRHPTPWRVVKIDHWFAKYFVMSGHKQVCQLFYEEDADDIAIAVNCHKELVKAVEHLSVCDFPDEVDFRCEGCNAARDVLEKATTK